MTPEREAAGEHEQRIASHPDDPEGTLADRLLLALGIWPQHVEELGADVAVEAAVAIRSRAHRFEFAAEDWATERDRAELAELYLERLATAVRTFLDDPLNHRGSAIADLADAYLDNWDRT